MSKLDFGKKLIEVRKANGLTQEDLAVKSKISVRTIQRIESGMVIPRVFTIKVLSEVLVFDFLKISNAGYEVNDENQHSNLNSHKVLWYLKDLFNLKTKAMRKVSILTGSFLIIGLLFGFLADTLAQTKEAHKQYNLVVEYHNDKTLKLVEANFTNELTLDSLIWIKNELYLKGFVVNYQLMEFDKSNHLISVGCTVSFPDGNQGSFSSSQLGAINRDHRFGFYYNASNKAKPRSGTGCIDCDDKQ